MSEKTGARVSNFVRQTLDLHLPVLLAMMADEGATVTAQRERAGRLVGVLQGAAIESSLHAGGRPVPVTLEKDEQGALELAINESMVRRVDDEALAGALADPVAQILDISPVSVGLVLRLQQVAQVRSIAGRLGRQADQEVASVMAIEEVVHWRLERFEKRLYSLVDGLGEWLEAPPLPRAQFLGQMGRAEGNWPAWRQVGDSDYMQAWQQALSEALGRTAWADNLADLLEIMWESMVISPASAMRQGAQKVRNLASDLEPGDFLRALGGTLEAPGQANWDALEQWPGAEALSDAWQQLCECEALILGQRGPAMAATISVLDAPGPAMGFEAPENLPWKLPLLCWTSRERQALCDLLQGSQKSLQSAVDTRQMGRLQKTGESGPTLIYGAQETAQWGLGAPSRWSEPDEGFSQAQAAAFGALCDHYGQCFRALDGAQQERALMFLKGTYTSYLASTQAVWERRLRLGDRTSKAGQFEHLLTALAKAVEWPIFVDPFEEGVPAEGESAPALAAMPGFTVPVVWYDGAERAPLWLPVNTIGEALSQAPLRARHVRVDAEADEVVWLGDQEITVRALRELATDGLLRSIVDGALRLVAHPI